MSFRLTTRQRKALEKMGLRAGDFSNEALLTFFNYTDKGILPEELRWLGKAKIVDLPGRAGDIFARFIVCSKGRQLYRRSFEEGWQFPGEFFDEPDAIFKQTALADYDVAGFERAIWGGMRMAREKGEPLEAAYLYAEMIRRSE